MAKSFMVSRISRSALLWLLGVAGAAKLTFMTPMNGSMVAASGLPEMSLRLHTLASSAVVLAVAVTVGALLAHRAGLQSLIVHRHALRIGAVNAIARAILVGLGLGFAIYLLDWSLFKAVPVFARLVDTEIRIVVIDWPTLVANMLYGGLVEEVILRWGLMSLLAWCALRFISGRTAAMWAAVAGAALISGLGHLPALYGILDNVPALLALRTVGLNLLAGLVFGYLYWTRNIEAAILAHGATVIGTATAQAILL